MHARKIGDNWACGSQLHFVPLVLHVDEFLLFLHVLGDELLELIKGFGLKRLVGDDLIEPGQSRF
jgi:hypothetical protein